MMIEGEGADVIPRNEENFVVIGVEMVFKKFGVPLPELAYFCKNGIPFGSGLGSSSAAIVSGLLAGLVLVGKELPVLGQEVLLQMAAEVEGHVDNIGPCIYGGIQLGYHEGQRWHTSSINTPVSHLECIVFTPTTSMSTNEARAMLPDTIPRADAVFNMSRLALLVRSLSSGSWDDLITACNDKLHQPIRGGEAVMPWLYPVVNAAKAAGAKGAFLSGAGSSIMALSVGLKGDRFTQSKGERKDAEIAAAMEKAAAEINVYGKVQVTKTSAMGAHVVSFTEMKSVAPVMKYRSTRDTSGKALTFKDVVLAGLAPDGGLYVPETIPKISEETLASWQSMSYTELAFNVMSHFIGVDDVPETRLRAIISKSYATFSSKHVVPMVKVSDSLLIMEQFHGPTCAFKDVALQFLGNMFEHFLETENEGVEPESQRRVTILGATSGDTGSAAIQGLRGKKNIEVVILFPTGRVADIQEAQMTTVLDENIHCVSVDGTFDDCQNIVKELFQKREFNEEVGLGAVNSINWCRILAQIVYYFYGYFRWLESSEPGVRKLGDKVTYAIPSGNFGNALAGFYAKEMGLPIRQLAACTNKNDILHRFFAHGDYSSKGCVPTLAPAMDITKASNFERYLFHLLGNDAAALRECMDGINAHGVLNLGPDHDKLMKQVKETFISSRASDEDIVKISKKYIDEQGYAPCPHTACGLHAAHESLLEAGHDVVTLATAHPGKFQNYNDEARACQPSLPPQLEGLLEKRTRVTKIEKSSAKVESIVRDFAAKTAKAKSKQTKVAGLVTGGNPAYYLLGAWVAGIVTAHFLLPLLKK